MRSRFCCRCAMSMESFSRSASACWSRAFATAKPLTRREEGLAISIDEERTRVKGGGAVVGAAVEDDAGVGLVGEQVDRAIVSLGCCRQGSGKLLQCLWRVH